MNTAALREQISRAHQHESSTGQLAQQLEVQLPHLHPAIALPDVDAKGVMTRFVSAYIDQVPDLLDAAKWISDEHLRLVENRRAFLPAAASDPGRA